MSDYQKTWQSNYIYNFDVELNRIENYNSIVENWLVNYYGVSLNLTHKVDWTMYDIVDLQDINRVKSNINKLLEVLGESVRVPVNKSQVNQVWTSRSANELEQAMATAMEVLSQMQFSSNVTGLTICGNNSRLNLGE